jgi:hypothetical protein
MDEIVDNISESVLATPSDTGSSKMISMLIENDFDAHRK